MTDATTQAPAGEFEVGAVVPPFTRPAGFHAWNRYAAVNYEFVDIHMDEEAGKAAGMPGAIGMGNLIWAWMHCAVEQWIGDRGLLEHLECRFKSPALTGDTITITGTVTGRTTADVAEAAAAQTAARERLAEFDSVVNAEVRQRLLYVDSSRAVVRAAGEAVRSAAEARRVVAERFAVGVTTSTDLLDAQVALLQAELDRTRALAAVRLSEARLDRALGRY